MHGERHYKKTKECKLRAKECKDVLFTRPVNQMSGGSLSRMLLTYDAKPLSVLVPQINADIPNLVRMDSTERLRRGKSPELGIKHRL